jgi:NAD(P)-dependent dehydrogenase (short-subunit alcohol dehydrogenase family)
MEAVLSSDEYRVRQVTPGNQFRRLAGNRYEADLSSPAALRELHEAVVGAEKGNVGAIFNFLGLAEPFSTPGLLTDGSALTLGSWVFNVLKEFGPDLRASAERGGGWAFNFTSLDGKFGLGGGPLAIAQAGTIGMFKTLKRECPELWVKSIDLDRTMDAQLIFSRMVEEMGCDDDLVEVGISQNARWKLALVKKPLAAGPRRLPLDEKSVVLVTGGAYGVTAEVVKELARQYKPTLVVVGRSALPAAEPADLQSCTDVATLRKVLLDKMRRENGKLLPMEFEKALSRVLKDRQIRDNIAAFQRAGATVEYYTADVRCIEGFGGLIDQVYERHGRIDGVIHGAGVIEDKLISQKSLESFANVFGTKAASAQILAQKLRPDSLKFLVFFSSVAGRFGNAGQVDYSAGNEYLNKLADHLDAQWPARVIAVNWGPWDGGMINDDLRRRYRDKQIDLIPPAEGSQAMLAELAIEKGEAELLLTCSVDVMANS